MTILLVACINVAFLVLIYLTLSRKISRLEKRGIPEELQDEMNTILTTFNRTADRNIDLLDDRLRKIEPLVERADRLGQQLDGLLRRTEAVQKLRELAQPVAAPVSEMTSPDDGTLTRQTAASAYREGAGLERIVPQVPGPVAKDKKARRKRRTPDEILREMTASGAPPEEIARTLGIPREEVLLKQRLLRLS